MSADAQKDREDRTGGARAAAEADIKFHLPTPEEMVVQDLFNNCAVRSAMSGVMGMTPRSVAQTIQLLESRFQLMECSRNGPSVYFKQVCDHDILSPGESFSL